ncbi:heterokaryon incompatibility protein-domain-containing protein [Aspergillus bertholletiae]|uniref:Heterokaryon incompatibility protein-domain-containing protein n=1 Tax=Aspergillus bertholletiae TaxID=1226010 RepID=A0A5N7BIQ9_9EURO|nr:heterokaryon incompatibility protein-domain-containing protein [Aspergillus bertholletiae]
MPEQFKYSPLPGPTCIRLVSFAPQDDSTPLPLPASGEPLLQLSLCTMDLQDTPHYEALSYTWGSPFPPKDKRSTAYDEKNDGRPVTINGHNHTIRRNLWEFLYQQQQTNANLEKEATEMLAAGLDTHGRTPLMRAVRDRRVDLTDTLLALGAETGAQDKEGKTALHYAVPSRTLDVECAELLVYYGADIYVRAHDGKAPLDNAKDEVAALLKSLNEDLGGKALPRGLRLSAQRPMWIDYISINQGNISERNIQVALMSDIYSKAMSVVVWLGVGDEDLPLLLGAVMRDPVPWILFTELGHSGMTGASLLDVMKRCYSPKQILNTLAINKLMERTWWSRTWVIQELALAKRTLIVCGSITTHPTETTFILGSLCNLASLGASMQDQKLAFNTMDLFEGARFSGVRGIEALMLANISFRTSGHTGTRELIVEGLLELHQAVPNVSWARRLSLQNLGRLSWWSHCSDPKDKVFALVGISSPDPAGRQININYEASTDKVFIQYGHLFMQGSPEPIQHLLTGECSFFEPLEGLSYVQDTPNPHPEFQDYKSKLPSWTPNFSAHLTTCRIWSHKFSAASDVSTTRSILPHSDPRTLCVSGHVFDDIVATEPAQNKGDIDEPDVLSWLELIKTLKETYPGGGSRVDALWQTLTVGKQDQNKNTSRKIFRKFITLELCQSTMNGRLKSILAELRKSCKRHTLPSFQELLKQWQELRRNKNERLVQGVQEKRKRLLKLVQELKEQGHKRQVQKQCVQKMTREWMTVIQELEKQAKEQDGLEEGYLKLTQERYYRSRCLFRTRKGYIGLGPVNVQPGDEVWLFATARTPFILRRPLEGSLGSETRSSISLTTEGERRTFIGETYVHGIMNGEAIRKGDFRPVSLV